MPHGYPAFLNFASILWMFAHWIHMHCVSSCTTFSCLVCPHALFVLMHCVSSCTVCPHAQLSHFNHLTIHHVTSSPLPQILVLTPAHTIVHYLHKFGMHSCACLFPRRHLCMPLFPTVRTLYILLFLCVPCTSCCFCACLVHPAAGAQV